MRESIGARTALTRGAALSDDAGSFKHNADIVGYRRKRRLLNSTLGGVPWAR